MGFGKSEDTPTKHGEFYRENWPQKRWNPQEPASHPQNHADLRPRQHRELANTCSRAVRAASERCRALARAASICTLTSPLIDDTRFILADTYGS